MLLQVDAHTLFTTLKRVRAGLSATKYWSTYPYVVLEAQQDRIVVSTWSGELRVDGVVLAKVEQEGTFAVNYTEFLQAVADLSGQVSITRVEASLLITSEVPGHQIKIAFDGEEVQDLREWKIVALPGSQYSEEKTVKHECETCHTPRYERVREMYQIVRVASQQVTVAKASLQQMVREIGWLPEYDIKCSALKGMGVERDGEKIVCIGANVYCIGRSRLASIGQWEHRTLVEASLFEKAVRALPKGDVRMEAFFTSHQCIERNDVALADEPTAERPTLLTLSSGNVTITLPLMSEVFPQIVDSIVPRSASTWVVCGTAELRNALTALRPVGNTVEFRLVESKLSLHVTLAPNSGQRDVSLLEHEGPDVSMKTNLSYLCNVLEKMAAPRVMFHLDGPEEHFVLRSSGGEVETSLLISAVRQ